MPEKIYNVIETQNGVPIKAWTKGVLLDYDALAPEFRAVWPADRFIGHPRWSGPGGRRGSRCSASR